MRTSLVFIGLLILSACSKEGTFKCSKIGNVIAYNYTKCGCCPGWLVATNSDTIKFEKALQETELSQWARQYGYPVKISFEYQDRVGACSWAYKSMTCLELLEHNQCKNQGQIIGYDNRDCMCCGGWIIKSGNDTLYTAELQIADTVSKIALVKGFPIAIKFSFEEDTAHCFGNFKKITCIELQ